MNYSDVSRGIQHILKEVLGPIPLKVLEERFYSKFHTTVDSATNIQTIDYLTKKSNIFELLSGPNGEIMVNLAAALRRGPPIQDPNVLKDEKFVVDELIQLVEDNAQNGSPVCYISSLCGKFIQRNGISVSSVIGQRPLEFLKQHSDVFVLLGAGNVTLVRFADQPECSRYLSASTTGVEKLSSSAAAAAAGSKIGSPDFNGKNVTLLSDGLLSATQQTGIKSMATSNSLSSIEKEHSITGDYGVEQQQQLLSNNQTSMSNPASSFVSITNNNSNNNTKENNSLINNVNKIKNTNLITNSTTNSTSMKNISSLAFYQEPFAAESILLPNTLSSSTSDSTPNNVNGDNTSSVVHPFSELSIVEHFRQLILQDSQESVYISSLCGRFLQKFGVPVSKMTGCKPADFLRRHPTVFVMVGGGHVGLLEVLAPAAANAANAAVSHVGQANRAITAGCGGNGEFGNNEKNDSAQSAYQYPQHFNNENLNFGGKSSYFPFKNQNANALLTESAIGAGGTLFFNTNFSSIHVNGDSTSFFSQSLQKHLLQSSHHFSSLDSNNNNSSKFKAQSIVINDQILNELDASIRLNRMLQEVLLLSLDSLAAEVSAATKGWLNITELRPVGDAVVGVCNDRTSSGAAYNCELVMHVKHLPTDSGVWFHSLLDLIRISMMNHIKQQQQKIDNNNNNINPIDIASASINNSANNNRCNNNTNSNINNLNNNTSLNDNSVLSSPPIISLSVVNNNEASLKTRPAPPSPSRANPIFPNSPITCLQIPPVDTTLDGLLMTVQVDTELGLSLLKGRSIQGVHPLLGSTCQGHHHAGDIGAGDQNAICGGSVVSSSVVSGRTGGRGGVNSSVGGSSDKDVRNTGVSLSNQSIKVISTAAPLLKLNVNVVVIPDSSSNSVCLSYQQDTLNDYQFAIDRNERFAAMPTQFKVLSRLVRFWRDSCMVWSSNCTPPSDNLIDHLLVVALMKVEEDQELKRKKQLAQSNIQTTSSLSLQQNQQDHQANNVATTTTQHQQFVSPPPNVSSSKSSPSSGFSLPSAISMFFTLLLQLDFLFIILPSSLTAYKSISAQTIIEEPDFLQPISNLIRQSSGSNSHLPTTKTNCYILDTHDIMQCVMTSPEISLALTTPLLLDISNPKRNLISSDAKEFRSSAFVKFLQQKLLLSNITNSSNTFSSASSVAGSSNPGMNVLNGSSEIEDVLIGYLWTTLKLKIVQLLPQRSSIITRNAILSNHHQQLQYQQQVSNSSNNNSNNNNNSSKDNNNNNNKSAQQQMTCHLTTHIIEPTTSSNTFESNVPHIASIPLTSSINPKHDPKFDITQPFEGCSDPSDSTATNRREQHQIHSSSKPISHKLSPSVSDGAVVAVPSTSTSHSLLPIEPILTTIVSAVSQVNSEPNNSVASSLMNVKVPFSSAPPTKRLSSQSRHESNLLSSTTAATSASKIMQTNFLSAPNSQTSSILSTHVCNGGTADVSLPNGASSSLLVNGGSSSMNSVSGVRGISSASSSSQQQIQSASNQQSCPPLPSSYDSHIQQQHHNSSLNFSNHSASAILTTSPGLPFNSNNNHGSNNKVSSSSGITNNLQHNNNSNNINNNNTNSKFFQRSVQQTAAISSLPPPPPTTTIGGAAASSSMYWGNSQLNSMTTQSSVLPQQHLHQNILANNNSNNNNNSNSSNNNSVKSPFRDVSSSTAHHQPARSVVSYSNSQPAANLPFTSVPLAPPRTPATSGPPPSTASSNAPIPLAANNHSGGFLSYNKNNNNTNVSSVCDEFSHHHAQHLQQLHIQQQQQPHFNSHYFNSQQFQIHVPTPATSSSNFFPSNFQNPSHAAFSNNIASSPQGANGGNLTYNSYSSSSHLSNIQPYSSNEDYTSLLNHHHQQQQQQHNRKLSTIPHHQIQPHGHQHNNQSPLEPIFGSTSASVQDENEAIWGNNQQRSPWWTSSSIWGGSGAHGAGGGTL